MLTLDLREGCDIALDVARDEFPPLEDIDVCVANAGMTTTIAPAHRMTAEQWQRDIDVNLTGAFRTIQACLPRDARARPRARSWSISSVAALGGLPGQVAYAASKAGQLGMVRTLAAENAGARDHRQRGAARARRHRAGARDARRGARAGAARAADRAAGRARGDRGAVAFLAGEEAAQVSGQAIAVDGGASLHCWHALGSESCSAAPEHRIAGQREGVLGGSEHASIAPHPPQGEGKECDQSS